MKNTMKRLRAVRCSTVVLMIITLLASTIVVYAVVSYLTTGMQTSSFTKKEYYEISGTEIFTAGSEVGPGEEVSINPVIESKSSMDLYVFFKVEMPVYGGESSGLYEFDVTDGWNMIGEPEVSDGQWTAVYGYENLTPGASTVALSTTLTMVDMPMDDFTQLEDVNVSITGYGCKTVDENGEELSIDEAWERISGE